QLGWRRPGGVRRGRNKLFIAWPLPWLETGHRRWHRGTALSAPAGIHTVRCRGGEGSGPDSGCAARPTWLVAGAPRRSGTPRFPISSLVRIPDKGPDVDGTERERAEESRSEPAFRHLGAGPRVRSSGVGPEAGRRLLGRKWNQGVMTGGSSAH